MAMGLFRKQDFASSILASSLNRVSGNLVSLPALDAGLWRFESSHPESGVTCQGENRESLRVVRESGATDVFDMKSCKTSMSYAGR